MVFVVFSIYEKVFKMMLTGWHYFDDDLEFRRQFKADISSLISSLKTKQELKLSIIISVDCSHQNRIWLIITVQMLSFIAFFKMFVSSENVVVFKNSYHRDYHHQYSMLREFDWRIKIQSCGINKFNSYDLLQKQKSEEIKTQLCIIIDMEHKIIFFKDSY